MIDNHFNKSIKIAQTLGESVLIDGKKLANAIYEINNINYFVAIQPYMYLYRFPMLTSEDCYDYPNQLSYSIRFLKGIIRYIFFTCPLKVEIIKQPFQHEFKKILIIATNENFFKNTLSPLIIKLIETNFNVSCLKFNKSYGKNLVIYFERNYLKFKIWFKLYAIYRKINWKNIFDLIESINQGYSRARFKDEVKWCLLTEIPRLVYITWILSEQIKEREFNLLLSADDADQLCRAIHLTAMKVGIKTIVIQQGITYKDYPDWASFTGNYVAAMSHKMAEVIKFQGVQGDKIEVTGNPAFDYLIKYNKNKNQLANQISKSISRKKIILFASQPYIWGAYASPAKRKEIIKIFLDGSSDEHIFIYKMHPVEKKSEVRKLLLNYPKVSLADSTNDLHDLIQKCDVFVTMFSQTTLDAICANKPVINIDCIDSGCINLFATSGATFTVNNLADYKSIMLKILGNTWNPTLDMRNLRGKLIKDIIYKSDGKSSLRIIEMVDKVINNS